MGEDHYICGVCKEIVSGYKEWASCINCNLTWAICIYCYVASMSPTDKEIKEMHNELKKRDDKNCNDIICSDYILYKKNYDEFKRQFNEGLFITNKDCPHC